MSVRTYVGAKVKQAQTVTDLKKAVLIEATVSTDDTVPVIELAGLTIIEAVAFKASDGAAITVSHGTNIVTITEAVLTNIKVYILAIA